MNVIVIDGVIGRGEGEYSKSMLEAELRKCNPNEPLQLRLHSEGGSVMEGFGMFDVLSQWPGEKRCLVQSMAHSIASFIPMACDDVEISPNGFMMIHLPRVGIDGTASELEQNAGLLRDMETQMIQAYCEKTGRTADEIHALLDRETYMNATKAVELGFANRIAGEPVIGRRATTVDKMPPGVVAALWCAGSSGDNSEKDKELSMSTSQPVAATLKEIRAAFPKAKDAFVVRCLEQELPMEQVQTAVMEDLQTTNTGLEEKCVALEQKCQALEAELQLLKQPPPAPSPAQPTGSTVPTAKVGVQPVASASGVVRRPVSARAEWNRLIAERSATMPRAQAIKSINRDFPNLQREVVEESNQ